MNPFTLYSLIALALVATGAYFYGTKKNRWLAAAISKDLEEVFRPASTNYVNIGGAIGYHFAYALSPPFTNAKGTMTLSPRHSLLYLPFSLLIGVRDRLFINVFTKRKLRGEGHAVRTNYLRKARIEGIDTMERREALISGVSFTLLWKGIDLSSDLEKTVEALPDPSRLKHFCSYPETKTLFYHVQPERTSFKANLEAVVTRLPVFLGKEKE